MVGIGLWLKFNYNNTVSTTNQSSKTQSSITKSNKPDEQPVIKDSVEKPKTKKQKVKALQVADDIAQELSQQKYSDEPLLEIATVSFLLDDCKKSGSLSYSHLKPSAKRESLFLEFKDNCETLFDDYPILTQSKSRKETEMTMLKIAMQSKYAGMIERAMGLKYLALEQKQEFLMEATQLIYSSKNAKIISFMGEMPYNSESKPFFNLLFDTLGTIDPIYTKMILSQASVLFSCQFNDGMTCSPTSKYMLGQCYQYENACGLDLQTWFQTHHTPAHNRDIAKVIVLFESRLSKYQ